MHATMVVENETRMQIPAMPMGAPTSESSDEAAFAYFAQTGCEDAFQIIFHRYERRIRNFLLKQIGDEAQAEDLTQNIFVRVLRNAGKFDPTRDFSTWCFTIVHNVLKNHYRSVSRNRMDHFSDLAPREMLRSTRSVDPVLNAPCPGAAPDTNTYRGELRAELGEALARLDPSIRDPFVLSQIEGNSYPHISESLALPVSTVKSRTNRARAELRQVLAAFSNA